MTPSISAAPPATKPDWLPDDTFWDKDKGEVKGTDLGKRFNEMATRIAADDVRKGSLPQTADAYKVELPADFKPPAGVEFKLDAANPSLSQLKQVAHKHGLTQEAVNELIGVYAGAEVGTQASIDTARAAEISKLGTTAPARVDAVTRWMDSVGLGALKVSLVRADQIEAFEKFITKSTSQGTAAFSQAHRDLTPAGKVTEEQWSKMSAAERMDYTNKTDQSQFKAA